MCEARIHALEMNVFSRQRPWELTSSPVWSRLQGAGYVKISTVVEISLSVKLSTPQQVT